MTPRPRNWDRQVSTSPRPAPPWVSCHTVTVPQLLTYPLFETRPSTLPPEIPLLAQNRGSRRILAGLRALRVAPSSPTLLSDLPPFPKVQIAHMWSFLAVLIAVALLCPIRFRVLLRLLIDDLLFWVSVEVKDCGARHCGVVVKCARSFRRTTECLFAGGTVVVSRGFGSL